MEVIAGTYEEFILGYRLICKEGSKKCSFETSFTDNSHTGSVRAVAVSGKGILATGSSDETIRLFSLKKRHEVGTLMQHEGSINGLSFFGKHHMFSYSDDGTICVWQVGRWECLRTLRGHKGPVFSMSVHPSGKMGLSIGKDKTLRIWNLMTAKCAFITNMKQVPEFVLWAPSGDQYLVCLNNKIDIYDVQTASVIHTVEYHGKIHNAVFISEETLAFGGEGGIIEIHNLETKESVCTFDTKTNRVKGLVVCRCPTDPNSSWLVTGSSDGFIKVWEVISDKAKLVAEQQTNFRLTSLAISNLPTGKQDIQEVKPEKEETEELGLEESAESEELGLEESAESLSESDNEVLVAKQPIKPETETSTKGKKKKVPTATLR